MQVVILLDKPFELCLYVGQLRCRETVFIQRHAGLLEVPQKTDFLWHQKHKCLPFPPRATSCAAHTVDVLSWVIGGINLNNPVYLPSTYRNKAYTHIAPLRANADSRAAQPVHMQEISEMRFTLGMSKPLAATSVQRRIPF